MSELVGRWSSLRERIHALRPTAQLLAVSKGQPFEKILELYQAGQRDFGENYVQELLIKRDAAGAAGLADIRWHLIGPLQRKKIPKLVPWLTAMHTVDRWEVAEALEARWHGARPLEVYVEVNLHREQEPQKAGVDPSEVGMWMDRLRGLQQIHLMGLMVIPPPGDPSAFAEMRALRDRLDPALKLSMGMSEDFEEALRQGADVVRVGTALFGRRA